MNSNNNNNNKHSEDEIIDRIKPKSKAGMHLLQAFKLAKSRLYQSATVEFKQACNLNQDEVVPIAKQVFKQKVIAGEYEFALSIGSLLYSMDKSDYNLATLLAGYARNVGNKAQAISLYKMALSYNSKYLLALCGLGAALEDVPYIDAEAVNAYKSLNKNSFILPTCIVRNEDGSYDFIKNYVQSISKEVVLYLKEQQGDDPMQDISLSAKSAAVSIKDTVSYLEHLIEKNPEKADYLNYNIIVIMASNNHNNFAAAERLSLLKNELKSSNKSLPYIDIIDIFLLVKSEEISLAKEKLMELIAKNKNDRYALVNLGLIYQQQNNLSQAARYLILGHYLLSRSYFKYQIETLVEHAHSKFRSNSFREAILDFEVLIEEGYASNTDIVGYLQCLEHTNQKKKIVDFIVNNINDTHKADEEISNYINNFIDSISHHAQQLISERKMTEALESLKLSLKLDERVDTIRDIINLLSKMPSNEENAAYLQYMKEKLQDKIPQSTEHKNKPNKQVSIAEQKINKIHNEFLKKAKYYIQIQKYDIAIKLIENAFSIKVEEKTYIILKKLYKLLNRDKDLINLEKQYKKHLDQS